MNSKLKISWIAFESWLLNGEVGWGVKHNCWLAWVITGATTDAARFVTPLRVKNKMAAMLMMMKAYLIII